MTELEEIKLRIGDSLDGIENYTEVGTASSSSYWEGVIADEQWYNENRPNPPATHMLMASTPYVDKRGLMRARTYYRFSTLEWKSYVNWNKEHE